MPQIEPSVPFTATISTARWSFYAFYIDSGVSSWSVSFSGTGDPNYYIARDRIPSLTDSDFRDVRPGPVAVFSPGGVVPGLYVIGIRAYCCDDATAVVDLVVRGTPICGDGKIDAGEECDDGNVRSGDGCSFFCRIERCVCVLCVRMCCVSV
jgi:cysteine-rich repeat protein